MCVNKNIYIFFSILIFLSEVHGSSTIKEVKKEITVTQKKQNFKDVLVPIVSEVFRKLESEYLSVKSDIQNSKNLKNIEKLKKEYSVKTNEALLIALKPHPISVVLAQAAVESAWLTSRFTKEANNIFGVWSFNKNEPRIAASGLRGDKTIYLKKYKTLNAAILGYYKNLGKHRAYKKFRKKRIETNDPYILSAYLTNYSETREKYTNLLKSIIKYNKFENYDLKSNIPLQIKENQKIKSDNI